MGICGSRRKIVPNRNRQEVRPEVRHRAEISCTILTAVAGALLRCLTLAVLVPRRARRLALHPATTARIAQLIPARRLSALLLQNACGYNRAIFFPQDKTGGIRAFLRTSSVSFAETSADRPGRAGRLRTRGPFHATADPLVRAPLRSEYGRSAEPGPGELPELQ